MQINNFTFIAIASVKKVNRKMIRLKNVVCHSK